LSKHKRTTRGSSSGRLRIVAGKWRSRLLPVVDEAGLRPTSERIRETLFNWLAPVIEGSRCLDLFAGSGALGIEALSRGAAAVSFVEQSGAAGRQLRRTLASLGAEGGTVTTGDALDLLQNSTPSTFDIVFIDPPFAADFYPELCRLLAERGWVSQGSLVYIEQDRTEAIPELPSNWLLQKEKTAGNVRYSLVRVEK
jgi:16S rRNA (guanine966-N2)-methyltransferase